MLIELAPSAVTEEDVPHEGEEFGYVLQGEIVVCLGSKRYACKKGESFYFVSGKAHHIENKKDKTAKFLWISSPPTF